MADLRDEEWLSPATIEAGLTALFRFEDYFHISGDALEEAYLNMRREDPVFDTLRQALMPFAVKFFHALDVSDNDDVTITVKHGDLRRAAIAYSLRAPGESEHSA